MSDNNACWWPLTNPAGASPIQRLPAPEVKAIGESNLSFIRASNFEFVSNFGFRISSFATEERNWYAAASIDNIATPL
jgi:hypothetical protein